MIITTGDYVRAARDALPAVGYEHVRSRSRSSAV
jgi:hypothetical protein